MANCTELFSYKEKIMEIYSSDVFLKKAIYNQGEDALSQPEPDFDLLKYKHVFPYKLNEESIEENSGNYIYLDFAATGLDSNTFKDISMTFYILVHKSMALLNRDGQTVVRADYLAHRVDSMINKQRGFGLGRVKFAALRPMTSLPPGYMGVALIYSTMDFS